MIKNIISNVQTENKTDDSAERVSLSLRERVGARGNEPSKLQTASESPPNFKLETLNIKLPGKRSSTGKIARLPADLREEVNYWIADGVLLDTISERLAALGHPGISQQNLSNWKANGYRKWLDHQQQVDDQRTRYEIACQLAKDLGHSGDSTQACAILVKTRLFELLLSSADETDPETARKINLQIFQLSRALSVYLNDTARDNRLQFDKQRHDEKIAAINELARSKRFHSEDNAIDTLNAMLGLKMRCNPANQTLPSPEPRQGHAEAGISSPQRGEQALPACSNDSPTPSTHPSIQRSAPARSHAPRSTVNLPPATPNKPAQAYTIQNNPPPISSYLSTLSPHFNYAPPIPNPLGR